MDGPLPPPGSHPSDPAMYVPPAPQQQVSAASMHAAMPQPMHGGAPAPLFVGVDPSQQQFVSNVVSNPMMGMAANYAADYARRTTSYLSFFDSFKYYFNVNHSYVRRKLGILLLPLLHKSWKRQLVQQDGVDLHPPPREDINAPDLYIPSMAFVTYVLLVGFVMGTANQFTPSVMGATASQGFAVLTLEVALLKLGFYLLEHATHVPVLDAVAFAGYKYVPVILTITAGMLGGRLGYYATLVITSLFLGLFMVKSLRLLVLPDSANSSAGQRSVRNTFLLLTAGVQFVLCWFLAVYVAPPERNAASSSAPSK